MYPDKIAAAGNKILPPSIHAICLSFCVAFSGQKFFLHV
jgi:hypothetical protein